jgi:DNA-binding XRE family transcriptional regulator
MDKLKKQRLENRGWKVGSVDQFLGLTTEENAYIELKLALADHVKERREKKQLTQIDLARLLRSSQSRVAKIEAGDSSVSLDLLVRSLIVMGATRRELAQVIGYRHA